MNKKIITLIIFILLLANINYVNGNLYKRSIDDDYKIHKTFVKINNIINNHIDSSKIRNKVVENILKKSRNRYFDILKDEPYSFETYALKYLYYPIKYNFSDRDTPKILENDKFRLFVVFDEIKLKDNLVYYQIVNGNKNKLIEFFEIDEKESLEDYVYNNLLEEKYKGKCRIEKNNGISFTKNDTYIITAYGDYKSKTRDPSDCGEYGIPYGIKYFEKKGNYLVFVSASREYMGIDFSLIEFKTNIKNSQNVKKCDGKNLLEQCKIK